MSRVRKFDDAVESFTLMTKEMSEQSAVMQSKLLTLKVTSKDKATLC